MDRVLGTTAGKCVAVFCGSASGRHHNYHSEAIVVGDAIARAGHMLVYGGGRVGLMGAVADGCLNAGGRVVGVIPQALVDREIAHTGLTEMIIAADMHERKAKMAEHADAFIVLPGGSGTLEEFFEQWTWAQIGYHQKPIGLLNMNGYFEPLLAMIDQMVDAGFLSEAHKGMLSHAPHINDLLRSFSSYNHPPQKVYEQH